MSAADRFSLRRPSRVLAAILVLAVGVWAGPAGAGTAKDKEKPPGNGAPANPGYGNGNGNGNGGGQPGPVIDSTGDPAAPALDESEAAAGEAADVVGESDAHAPPPDDDPAESALGSSGDEDESQPETDESAATRSGSDGGDGTDNAASNAPAPASQYEKPGAEPKPSLPPPPAPAPSQAPIPIAPNWTQPLPLAAPAPKATSAQTRAQRVLGRWHSSRSHARVVRGVNGAAAVEVTAGNARGRFTLVTAKPLVADRTPYRVNAWLRTDTPGLTVCLRFVEKQPGWKGKRVRSSETCVAPETEWKRYRVDALSVARGNVLRVAAVVYGSFGDATFELSRLKVEKKVNGRWTKLRGAKLTPSS